MTMTQEFSSVWDALEDNFVAAQNLRLRSQLMMIISDFVKHSGLPSAKAATELGTTQPRLNDVLSGAIEHCTLDKLMNMAASVGYKISMQFEQLD